MTFETRSKIVRLHQVFAAFADVDVVIIIHQVDEFVHLISRLLIFETGVLIKGHGLENVVACVIWHTRVLALKHCFQFSRRIICRIIRDHEFKYHHLLRRLGARSKHILDIA